VLSAVDENVWMLLSTHDVGMAMKDRPFRMVIGGHSVCLDSPDGVFTGRGRARPVREAQWKGATSKVFQDRVLSIGRESQLEHRR